MAIFGRLGQEVELTVSVIRAPLRHAARHRIPRRRGPGAGSYMHSTSMIGCSGGCTR